MGTIKLICFKAAIILSFLNSSGQSHLELRAGTNYSVFDSKSDSYTSYFKSGVSFDGGLGYTMYLHKNIGLSLRLNYLSHAATIDSRVFSPSHSIEYNYDLKLGYLSLSLIPEFAFGANNLFVVHLGPYFSYLTNSKIDGTKKGTLITSGPYEITLTGKADDYYKNTDLGFMAGFGMNIKLTEDLCIFPKINYHFGFLDIGDGYFTTYDISVYKRAVGLSIGFKYLVK